MHKKKTKEEKTVLTNERILKESFHDKFSQSTEVAYYVVYRRNIWFGGEEGKDGKNDTNAQHQLPEVELAGYGYLVTWGQNQTRHDAL